MKKAAKSGNNKKQKESAEEIAKLEREMDERHKREKAECEAQRKEMAMQDVQVDQDGIKDDKEELSFYKEKTTKGKNQKRQERKAELRKKAAEAAYIDEEASKSSLRTTEMKAVEKILQSRGLTLVDIPPDGDCLFHAVAHQLTEIGKQSSGADLRRKTAAFIRSHKDDFLPFLSNEEGDILDEFQFEEYCVKVEEEASTGGHWGGEPELRALAECLERKIEVLQPDSRMILFGESFDGSSLVITYHRHAYDLGEHYNSTTRVTN